MTLVRMSSREPLCIYFVFILWVGHVTDDNADKENSAEHWLGETNQSMVGCQFFKTRARAVFQASTLAPLLYRQYWLWYRGTCGETFGMANGKTSIDYNDNAYCWIYLFSWATRLTMQYKFLCRVLSSRLDPWQSWMLKVVTVVSYFWIIALQLL